MAELLWEIYRINPQFYALVATTLVVIVGALFGFLMDWIGRKLGVDTSEIDHNRETV